jgi:predicted nucleotidyltransferase
LAGLTAGERDCVDRYVDRLSRELGENLEEVWLFGSAARRDMWADFWPMRSDIDLLVLTSERLPKERQDQFFSMTYEPFLQCGRQISPLFLTHEELRSEQAQVRVGMTRDGLRLWPESRGS